MSALTKLTDEEKQAIADAKQVMQDSEYGVTAVKFELEAQLNRPEDDYGSESCYDCAGSGRWYCDNCESGYTECPEGHSSEENFEECTVCEGSDSVTCSTCDGWESQDCEQCSGSGEIETEQGYWGESECQDFIESHISDEANSARIYGRFYNDGSVDSEYTFTLKLHEMEYAIEYIEAFKKLADEIGNGMDTEGAGMHIAVIKDRNGNYPAGRLDSTCSENFEDAMTPLLPALYFMGSNGYESRGLRYRPPKIDLTEKYAAVAGGGHCAIEYRLFETCYDNPLAVVDYLMVIANTIGYYSKEPTDTRSLINKGQEMTLGIRDGYGIERFYYTLNHLNALREGVKLIKPSYKTYRELKEERNFKVTEGKLRSDAEKRIEEYKKEFESVKKRRHHERLRLYHSYLSDAYYHRQNGADIDVREYARNSLKEAVAMKGLKGNLSQYIQQRVEQFNNADYSITI